MGGKRQDELQSILRALQGLVRPEKAKFLPQFFKAFPGGYGEGDRFLGVVVPDIRNVAKRHRNARTTTISQLLDSPFHELRMCALLIIVDRFQRAEVEDRSLLVKLYLSKLDRVNNWDLVDVSAPNILGAWLLDKPRSQLYDLVESEQLWRQRVAVLATLAFIRNRDFSDTLRIADILLVHEHDLIHKAVGWMLREIGNRDRHALETFLFTRYTSMPRTMLRYAIEKFPDPLRQGYLKGHI